MNPIAFSGALTLEDYLLSNRLYLRTLPFQGRVEIVWGVIFLIGLGLAVLHGVDDWQRWLTIGVVAGVPFLLFMRRSTALQNAWKEILAQKRNLYQGTITEQGIEAKIGPIRIYTDWELLEYYQARDDLLILYHSPYSVITVAPHFFAHPSDWQQFRALVFQTLPSKYPSEWMDTQLLLQSIAGPLISVIVVLMTIYL